MNSAGETTGAQGCDVAGSSTHNIAAAVATAAAADVVILALGIDQTQEREGEDRVITTLPGMQRYLVAEVTLTLMIATKRLTRTQATPTPTTA